MRKGLAASFFRLASIAKKHKWPLIFGFFLLLFVTSLGVPIHGFIAIVILSVIAAFSTYYRKYVKLTVGFETVTFATVLCTVAYGPMIGALVGLVSCFAAEFIPQLIDPSSFLWILSYPVVALVVYWLHGLGVPLFWLGMAGTAVQNIIAEPIRFLSGDELLRTMGFLSVTGSIISNIILFNLLAGPVLSIM